MPSITITLDLPDGRMSGHANGSWRGKAALTKAQRFAACVMATATGKVPKTPWAKAVVSIRFFLGSRKRRDVLNLVNGCKPLLDGIVDAGIISDDSWEVLSVGSITCQLDKSNPRAEIVLERHNCDKDKNL